MKLADRLNQALAARELSVKISVESLKPIDFNVLVEEQVEQVEQVAETIQEAISLAETITADDFGLKIVLVKQLDLNEIKLPMKYGNFIIDDIQKRTNLYEIHLVQQ